jgi:hypothetical protein
VPHSRPLLQHRQEAAAPIPRMHLPTESSLPQPRRGGGRQRAKAPAGRTRTRKPAATKAAMPHPGPPIGSPPGLAGAATQVYPRRRNDGSGSDQPVLPPLTPGHATTSPGASKSPTAQRADSPLWNAGGSYLNAYRTGAPTAHLQGVSHSPPGGSARVHSSAREVKHSVFSSDATGSAEMHGRQKRPEHRSERTSQPTGDEPSRGTYSELGEGVPKPTSPSNAGWQENSRQGGKPPARSAQGAAAGMGDGLLRELEAGSSELLQTVSASDQLHRTPRRMFR